MGNKNKKIVYFVLLSFKQVLKVHKIFTRFVTKMEKLHITVSNVN